MTNTWILYQTTNNVNGKIYVGVHRVADTSASRNYLGSGKALKTAIKIHGKENFIRITLAEFSSAEDAYLAEEKMVSEEFVKRTDTYNMKIGGLGCKVHTEETKAKISTKARGRAMTEKTKEKLRDSHKGKKLTEEHKDKLRVFQLGRVRSAETRARMSSAQKCRVTTEETKAKLVAANKGKIHTEETRAKMSAASTNSKPVMIRDKYYISGTQAAQSEKVSFKAAQWRFRSPDPKWSEWRYATEEEISNFSAGGVVEVQNLSDNVVRRM